MPAVRLTAIRQIISLPYANARDIIQEVLSVKKRLRYTVTLILAIMLCAVFTHAPAESLKGVRNAELDQIFSRNGVIRLEETVLDPGELSNPLCPLDLSPDGKTVLWRCLDSNGRETLALVREDGTAIPVYFNPYRGIGDPFEKEEFITAHLSFYQFPGWGGLSWSQDGRYITFSFTNGARKDRSVDVPVLDTATSEVYLADSYSNNPSEDDNGIVIASQISRDGDSIFYLVEYTTGGQKNLQFCRCTIQGVSIQVLYDVSYDEQVPFDVGSHPILTEAADGSWLLVGYNGEIIHNPRARSLALVQFIPSEDGWSLKTHSLHIPRVFNNTYAPWSAESGYGLLCITDSSASTMMPIDQSDLRQVFIRDALGCVNLVRVLPGEDFSSDVWCMMETPDGAQMLPADDYLWSLKLISQVYDDSEEEEIQRRISEITERTGKAPEDPLDLLPEGYSIDTYQNNTLNRLTVTCISQSPDGYYALINAGIGNVYNLYLVNLETMQVRLVESPEGIGGSALSVSSSAPFYAPGIVWNEDGTILIKDNNNKQLVRTFRLSAE